MTGAASPAYEFGYPHLLGDDELTSLLGGKGAHLATMTRVLRLPVPPGFTVTTDTCRRYLAGGWPAGLDAEIDRQVGLLERRVGRRLGDAANPLLVSVRSGAPVSMPGMMDTILNLGLNAETTAGLAKVAGDESFAHDCHRRFVDMFRSTVGVDAVPESPREQLRTAIEAVFRSWDGDRARVYRTVEGIDHGLGTAVTVQAMVFGNRGPDSATGVLFTRDPSTGANEPFGDVLFDAQGEDVVDGRHATEPLAALAERLPAVAQHLHAVAATLERHFADLCDIEFTVEQGRLWLLQVRAGKRSPQAALRIALDMADEEGFPLTRRQAIERVAPYIVHPPRRSAVSDLDVAPLTTGLAASPGVATGRIVTSPEEAVRLAAEGVAVILVRRETAPADVHGMAAAVAILTSTGGLASHAAVVARGWGRPAVVGAADVVLHDDRVEIGGHSFAVHDVITVDGDRGEVFAGELAGRSEPVPEAAVLRAWAEELGVDVRALAATESPVPTVDEEPEETAGAVAGVGRRRAEAVIRTASIKNLVTVDGLAPVIGIGAADVAATLDELVAAGLVQEVGPMHRLTPEGLAQARHLLAADQAHWTVVAAEAALDDLQQFDQRLKQVMTRWQVRSVDGVDALNDHRDASYDAAVLAELGGLHDDAGPFLARLADGLPRLDGYRNRLERALARARGGEGRFVAGALLDSYHTVWFELHEELIRLAGTTREAEAAAGRADGSEV
jgi:pyruvate,orthophosphate dikinase